MSDKENYIVTVRFPEWEMDGTAYKAFGKKYFITTPIIQMPDWEADDERWMSYDPTAEIKEEFKRQFVAVIGHPFDGEILFVDPSDLVVLAPRATKPGVHVK